jgi:hypothetical protein
MPWCEDCAKFWTPSSMTAEGACPTCGRVLAPPPEPGQPAGEGAPPAGKTITVKDIRRMAAGEDDGDEAPGAPWHFKLMLAALAIYLGYRAVQLVLLVFR